MIFVFYENTIQSTSLNLFILPATFRLTVNPAGNRITSKHQTRSTTPLSSCSYAAMRLKNPVANYTLISSNTMVLQQNIGLH